MSSSLKITVALLEEAAFAESMLCVNEGMCNPFLSVALLLLSSTANQTNLYISFAFCDSTGMRGISVDPSFSWSAGLSFF